MTPLRPPAPQPCESCPYRRDVPSGIWALEEYDKLRDFDDPMGPRMLHLFQCHQQDAESDAARLCGGWTGVHGPDSIRLRLAVARGEMPATVLEYESPVDLFASGNEAADHGQAEIRAPSAAAERLIGKIVTTRPDVRR